MTVGMAGVAGTILAAYASLLGAALSALSARRHLHVGAGRHPDGQDHHARRAAHGRAAARGDGAPVEQKIDVAETFEEGEQPANVIMAAAQGAQTGVKLAVAVGAMVLAFVALVALANGLLGGVGGWFGYPDLSFQRILGYVFQPVMFLLGVPWNEAGTAGGLFGTKMVLNEFVAFIDLGAMPARHAQRPKPARSSPSRSAASPISARSRSRWR